MNEFFIINKYLKNLSLNDAGAFKLNDDIFFDYKKKIAISVDTYVYGVHFLSTKPIYFLKKIIRASLSDLYCKGIKPKSYFLSFSLSKKLATHSWFKNISKVLRSEQLKFNITLVGGDTVYSSKLIVTVVVLGGSVNYPVLRKGCSLNDDIYVTGDIGDSYIGLNVLKKKYSFVKLNVFYKKKYYEPNLPTKIYSYLYKIASSSIDISDGLGQDLNHLCKMSKFGAFINLNLLPLSTFTKQLVLANKIKINDIFSKGDDYQILFTSKIRNRSKINSLSKKLKTRISRIGYIKKENNIVFNYNHRKLKINPKKMGYTHKF